MTETRPLNQMFVPLEYRYALDAAMSVLVQHPCPIICCNIPELEGEVSMRLPQRESSSSVALWIEPLKTTWKQELKRITSALSNDRASLVIIASCPLAHFLSKRKLWRSNPLGTSPLGMIMLRRMLIDNGFVIDAMYGFHAISSIIFHGFSCWIEKLGYGDVSDDIAFHARLRYYRKNSLALLSTVRLMIATKQKQEMV